jgi:RNA exonuclease 4
MDFQTCRTLVQSWLHAKPILVGHALVNDLEALCLSHPWYNIRDSATYLPFTKPCCHGACPKRLRDLAQEELGISIQRDGTQHCSVVDARAAMELYKHKQNEWDLYVRIHRNYAMNWPYYPLGGCEHGK